MEQMDTRKNSKGNRICGRICILVEGKLKSPVLIGSGEDEMSDYDVILNTEGKPFFPGSSVAGALKSYLKKVICQKGSELGEKIKLENADINDLLGTGPETSLSYDDSLEEERQSRLYVYDAMLEHAQIIKRDGIRLNEYKTTKDMGKFDLQAVETGAAFFLRLEVIQREKNLNLGRGEISELLKEAQEKDMSIINFILTGLENGELRLGGKSRRGFGKLGIEKVKIYHFNMMDRESGEKWLDWNWEKAYKDIKNRKEKQQSTDFLKSILQKKSLIEHNFLIPLEISQTLLIRQYGTLTFGEKNNLNCSQLRSGKVAVIPGSTWSGAIRGRLAKILLQTFNIKSWEIAQKCLDPFFGTWAPDELREKQEAILSQSQLIFEESRIDGGKPITLTRNAVDRFTGSAVKGALFTEEVWVGGKVNLQIRWSKKMEKENSDIICGLLYIVAQELRDGFLSVGGEQGIGRGIFKEAGAIQFDGEELTAEKALIFTEKAIQWCKKQEEKPDENL